jgi:hypothetical protein
LGRRGRIAPLAGGTVVFSMNRLRGGAYFNFDVNSNFDFNFNERGSTQAASPTRVYFSKGFLPS